MIAIFIFVFLMINNSCDSKPRFSAGNVKRDLRLVNYREKLAGKAKIYANGGSEVYR